jgi:protoporphyrinogen oxidase
MNSKPKRLAIIAGAGPAGLTCALELLRRTDYVPLIIEKDELPGGLSRTVTYKNNRLDIGGHRFFSKSQRVLDWWNEMLPFEQSAHAAHISYHGKQNKIKVERKQTLDSDDMMMLRPRKTRIFYDQTLFDYPVSLSFKTFKDLGFLKTMRIITGYIRAKLFPRKPEVTLEDFFINSFGTELYKTFFKSYSEKVWGKPCHEISAEWGKQRVKGVSLTEIVKHSLNQKLKLFKKRNVETSLIDSFLYPPRGPGQLWEKVAREITELGGTIIYEHEVTGIHLDGAELKAITFRNKNGHEEKRSCDMFFSTMPVQQLVSSIKNTPPPPHIKTITDNLEYRDFIIVGVLTKKISAGKLSSDRSPIKDNWIYIHEPGVSVARIEIFNNWSDDMVASPEHIWLGVEYIIHKDDTIWKKDDRDIAKLAIEELSKIKFAHPDDILDTHVVRAEKAYPVYAGSYEHFDKVKDYVNGIDNLFLLGRNGMHKYNNQDHSMLTAMTAVDMIASGQIDKSKIWAVNTEEDYHEEK